MLNCSWPNRQSFLRVGGDKSDAAELMNQSVSKYSPRFVHDGQQRLLWSMSCIVLAWYSFIGLCSGVTQTQHDGSEVKVRKWGEREEPREEVLRHCASSRRSADAGDSLAAVVSPPYRQRLSDTFCRQSSATHSLCVFESPSAYLTTWIRTSVRLNPGESGVMSSPPLLFTAAVCLGFIRGFGALFVRCYWLRNI